MNRLNKLEEYIDMSRLNELLGKKEEEKKKCKCCHTMCCIFAVIGAIVAVAGIAYAVYRYLKPDYLDDFEDDFDDDFDDDFFEDEDEEESESEEAPAEDSEK